MPVYGAKTPDYGNTNMFQKISEHQNPDYGSIMPDYGPKTYDYEHTNMFHKLSEH